MQKFNSKLYNSIKKLTNNFNRWVNYKPINDKSYYNYVINIQKLNNIDYIDSYIKERISNGENNLHQLIATFKDNFSL